MYPSAMPRQIIEITPELIQKLDPNQMSCLKAIANQEAFYHWFYYSKVKFDTVRAGVAPGPYTYTIAQGTEARAFSYGRQDPLVPAGFLAADGAATLAETNLIQGARTISGERLYITGVAFLPLKGGSGDPTVAGLQRSGRVSDGRLLAEVASNFSVRIALNGDQNSFPMGLLEMLPGAGGLTGQAVDQLATQPIPGGRTDMPFSTNGWPVSSNYFEMPEGLTWNPAGQRDSTVEIIFRAERDIILDSGGDPDNPAADEAAAAGIRGYNYPTQLFQDLVVFFKAETMTARTRVA